MEVAMYIFNQNRKIRPSVKVLTVYFPSVNSQK